MMILEKRYNKAPSTKELKVLKLCILLAINECKWIHTTIYTQSCLYGSNFYIEPLLVSPNAPSSICELFVDILPMLREAW